MRALALVAALAGVAHADGYYFGEQVGTATVRGELGERFDGGSIAAHIGFGRRIGPWAVEVGFGGYGLTGRERYAGRSYILLSGGFDVRRSWSLLGPLEIYGRAGLRVAGVDQDDLVTEEHDAQTGFNGAGGVLGAGLRVGGRLPEAPPLPLRLRMWASLETMTMFLGLEQGQHTVSGRITSVMLGIHLGSDF